MFKKIDWRVKSLMNLTNQDLLSAIVILESMTGQKSTVQVYQRKKRKRVNSKLIGCTYSTLRKDRMYNFLDFLISELLFTDSKFKPIALNSIKNIDHYNFRFCDFLEMGHLHRIFNSVGFVDQLMVNFRMNDHKFKGGIQNKILISGFQIPFVK
jgi:hypothetical protein